MSQTETLLLVALGFSLAMLLALFLGRFFWAAALRLGARRMQKQVPSTVIGLQTERDRLRAEYAMLSQRLGSRIETAKLQMAEQMAEVSRHRNRLETLEGAMAEREATIAALNEKLDAMNAGVAARAAANATLEMAIAEKQAALDQAQLQISELVRLAAIPAAVVEAPPASEAKERLRQRIGKLTRLAHAAERGPAEADAESADPLVLEKLSDADRQTEDLQKELEKLDAEWSKRLDAMDGRDEPPPQDTTDNGTVVNVISLANRIRALKDMGRS